MGLKENLWNKNLYDLYIIDINIPKISGLELLKYIRQKDLKTPVVIITASLELENIKTAYKNGCDEYIKKPFYLEELEIKIDKICKVNCDKNVIKISENIFYDFIFSNLLICGKKIHRITLYLLILVAKLHFRSIRFLRYNIPHQMIYC